MHRAINWLHTLGYKPAKEWTPADVEPFHIHPRYENDFITVPGLPNYLPPVIPNRDSWRDAAIDLVHTSFLALIADIWTQILVGKRDAKEKPLYIFWDDEVPKPNRLTALAWLLTCETWPMPNHRGESPDLDVIFPMQSFLLPQSTPFGFAGVQPINFALGSHADIRARSLNALLTESMHRGDRDKMAEVAEHPPIRRPPARVATSYGHHTSPESADHYYTMGQIWPRTSTRDHDQGMAAQELMESQMHHELIRSLRVMLMSRLLVQPGMPTHRSNLHNPAGLWIRNWSEMGIIAKASLKIETTLGWTPNRDPIKLENGSTFNTVPVAAPRTWFGFTHIGPKYEGDGDSIPAKRVETASERWADAYMKHRSHALQMLFHPESIDTAHLLDEAASTRAKLLERAGRLKKTADAKVGGGFAAAFANIVKPQENQE